MTQKKIVFSRSLTHSKQFKNDLLEWMLNNYKKNGIHFKTFDEMIQHKFEISLSEYLVRPITKDERLLYYKIKGSYHNHVKL